MPARLPDVSMDSGAAQEYDVFTSTLSGSSVSASAVGWLGDAGTSAASPIWAGLIAIADQGRVLAGGTPLTGDTQTLPALYSLPAADFHDILYGNNGDPAGPGYDLATGLGTPVANLLVPDLAGYEIPSQLTIKTEPPSSVVAGSPFGLTVEVEDRLGNAASGGTVTVALGNNPGDATLGGTLTVTVVNGVATFSDLTLSQPGTGYTLTVTDSAIAGAQTTTSITVTAASQATKVNVLPQSTPTPSPAMIIGEQPVFRRKLKKNGRPVGKAVLVGFMLDFNGPLGAAAVSNPGNYELRTVTFKKVNRGLDRVVHPIKRFTVTYTPASDSVTLELAGTQSFRTGGRLTVLPGVTSASGGALIGTTEFTITPGGKTIEPS